MLEDHVVHLPAPKTNFAKDISLTSDTPISFYGKTWAYVHEKWNCGWRERGMVEVMWEIFDFTYQIPGEQQLELPSCARCFALIFPSET